MPRMFHWTQLDPRAVSVATRPDAPSWHWRHHVDAEGVLEPDDPLLARLRAARPALPEADRRLLALAMKAAGAARERAFEAVRAERFAHLPSRRSCLFGIPVGQDPRAAAARMGLDLGGRRCVVLAVDDPQARVHRADTSHLDCAHLVGEPDALVAHALRYWGGEVADPGRVELLVEGRLAVLGQWTADQGSASSL